MNDMFGKKQIVKGLCIFGNELLHYLEPKK